MESLGNQMLNLNTLELNPAQVNSETNLRRMSSTSTSSSSERRQSIASQVLALTLYLNSQSEADIIYSGMGAVKKGRGSEKCPPGEKVYPSN